MEKFVPFLKTVAEDLVEKNGESNDFSNLTIVFPNKRARLFMNKYLLDVYNEQYGAKSPLWSPDYATSSNLLEYFARLFEIPLTIVPDVNRFQLVQLLYNAYKKEAQKKLDEVVDDEVPRKVLTKSLDEFYFLGELILNDFDDIDKHLVDANKLFRNFKEMKDLETLDYLTEEQVKAIQDFLKRDFNTDTSLFKGFITLWELLGDIYVSFKQDLESKGLAYAGMLHRKVAEKMADKNIGLPEDLPEDRRFAFVGFNALNGCEKILLKKLSNRQTSDGKPLANFYWDYDVSYFDPDNMDNDVMRKRKTYRDDAGTFLRANIGGFSAISHTSSQEMVFLSLPNALKSNPNELDNSKNSHDYLSRLSDGKHMKVLAASSDTAQTKYVSKFISDLKAQGVKDNEIAIVLCDEKLLPGVLHSIPSSVEYLNVTMGFPVTQTPAYTLVNMLVQLQLSRGKGKRFAYANVVSLLRCGIIRKWNLALVEHVLRQLQANAKSYISTADLLELVRTFEGGNKEKNTDFIGALFNTDCLVSMEDDAEGLIRWLVEVLRLLSVVYASTAKSFDTPAEHNFVGLYEEAYYQVFRMVNCVSSAQEGETMSVALCVKLLNKMFSSAKVPYSGEPARGMQVLGFLETRSLDFKHVLMLSVGENYMPKASFAPSFIPYALRIGFNLPAIEHEDALYAYNFFRLLQRPTSITLVYNTSAQTSNGEQSRFIRQLKEEYNAFGEARSLAYADAKSVPVTSLYIQKSDEDIAYMKERYGFMDASARKLHNDAVKADKQGVMKIDLSPSALNCYLDCSLRFYFRYIKHLVVDDDFDMDVDEAYFGRIFHKTMELIYCSIAGEHIGEDDWHTAVSARQLEPFMETKKLESLVDAAFASEFNVGSVSDYTGIQLIKRDVLVELVKKQVAEDIRYAGEHGFIIYRPEFAISQPVEVELTDNSKFLFALGGVLDRRDLKDNVLRVVDYKTGGDADGHKRKVKNVELMFSGGAKRGDKVFQATLYSCLWNMRPKDNESVVTCYNKEDRTVKPVLMFPRQMNDDFNPQLMLGERNDTKAIAVNSSDADDVDVESEFMDNLKSVLRQMLNKDVPFEATPDNDSCSFCDFKAICHREDLA